MKVKHFFDPETATFTYVVTDEKTKKSAVIDPVLNFNEASGKLTTVSADQVIAYVQENAFTLEWILETHAHADHLSSSQYIKNQLGGKVAIGAHISEVIAYWAPVFNIKASAERADEYFDHLFAENEVFHIGETPVRVLYTPGHTPACSTYVMNDIAFVGDTIFMPYVGTARTDFPGGSAKTLYHSIQKLYALPENTMIYVCHDYPPEGVEASCCTTVAEQLKSNAMINQNVSEADFVAARNKKDAGKAVPKLLLPSIQVNMVAGRFQPKESNDTQYIKIPINKL